MVKYYLIVCLFISNFLGAQLNVDFSADVLSGCEVAEVSFSDLSVSTGESITNWNWTIGTITSSEQNPQFLLNQVGSYDVCLTVTTTSGNASTECKTNYITIHPNPEVLFEFTQDKTCSPSTVRFTETSPSNIVSWTWDIGGSANIINTTDPNELISTTYESGGSYSVSLILSDENGCSNIATEQNLINVDQSPNLDLNIDIPSACQLPVDVAFMNNNIETGITYNWDLGNGELFEGDQPPLTSYTADGIYIYTVTASGSICETVVSDTVRITTNPEFSFNYPLEKCAENTFFLLNNSGVSYDSIEWRTNTGLIFKSENNTSIKLFDAGCYDFEATIFVNDCIFTYQLPDCITIIEKPQANIVIDVVDPCNLPTWVYISADVDESMNPQWQISNGAININSTNPVDSFQLFTPDQYTVVLTLQEADDCRFVYELPNIIVDELSAEFPEPYLGGCAPTTQTLSAVINANSDVTYLWSVPDLNLQSTEETFDVSLIDTGAYEVILIIENEAGCRDTLAQENYLGAGMEPITGMTFDPDPICAGGPLLLSDQSSDFSTEWCWSFNNPNIWISNQSINYEFPDTGYFDIVHTSFHHGCPGDTIEIEDAIYVSGPIINFEVVQSCGDPEITVNGDFIDTDDFSWTIELDGDDFVSTVDTFDYTFDTPGIYTLIGNAFNASNNCVAEVLHTILVSDEPYFEVDTTRGCVPLEIEVLFDNDLFTTFEAPDAEFLSLEPGRALLRYNNAGKFRSPFVTRTLSDICIDTIGTDSIFVNEVDALFSNNQKFCAPELHQMTNLSTSLFGMIEEVSWNVGDGAFLSNDFDGAFLIEDDQKYSALLTVRDDWGCVDSIFKPNALLPIILLPEFTVDTIGCTDYEFEFINLTVGQDIVATSWDFGDGQISNEPSIAKHKFANEGIYNVCLTIEESIGCTKSVCKEIEIRNPVANFSADPTSIDCPPLLVNFQNLSQNANEFIWDFGDNSGFSLLENPSHIYNEVENFDVQLIASFNGVCADTFEIVDLVNILGPKGEWEFEFLTDCLPLEVSFTAESDDQYKYTWDFGNGELSPPSAPQLSDNTTFIYDEPGVYLPKLLLDNGNGCIIAIEGDSIEVNEILLDLDYFDGVFCSSPGTVNINNLSDASNLDVQYTWTFLNQNQEYTSTELNPVFEVFETGDYQIKLVGESQNCKDSIVVDDILIIDNIEVFAPNDTICFDQQTVLFGEGTAMSYIWEDSSGNILSDSDSLSLRLKEDMEFVLIGQRPGCPDATDTGQVLVSNEIQATFDTEYESYSNLSAQFNIEYEGNLEFLWSPSIGLSCTTCANPTMRPDSMMNYMLTITDADSGCFIDTTILVRHIADCTEDALFSPNIMNTESAENSNARVYFENEDEFISLSIYDRWGNQIYFSESITDTWDGRFKGQLVESGVYVMQVQAVCVLTQRPFTVYRDITVLR